MIADRMLESILDRRSKLLGLLKENAEKVCANPTDINIRDFNRWYIMTFTPSMSVVDIDMARWINGQLKED